MSASFVIGIQICAILTITAGSNVTVSSSTFKNGSETAREVQSPKALTECPNKSTECIISRLRERGLIKGPDVTDKVEHRTPKREGGLSDHRFSSRGRGGGRGRGRGNRYQPDCWTDNEQAPAHLLPAARRREDRRVKGNGGNPWTQPDRQWRGRRKPCLWQEQWGPAN